jgi:hypothetical protein
MTYKFYYDVEVINLSTKKVWQLYYVTLENVEKQIANLNARYHIVRSYTIVE